MKTFEAFKASREKMDPSTRKMSEHQWTQAYAAYRSARERSRSSTSSSGGQSRRRSSSTSSASGMHAPSAVSASGALRARVRAESAYADQRLLVNVLSWVIVGAIGIATVLQAMMLAVPSAAGAVLLVGVVQVLVVIVLRMLVHVIIDIPDVALYRASFAAQEASETSTVQ
jgi:hypothetical protein